VPQRAVGELQGSYSAVVEADNTVRIQGVTAGERIGTCGHREVEGSDRCGRGTQKWATCQGDAQTLCAEVIRSGLACVE